MVTVLSGHTSPDTAYIVEDYPYGFRLRCRIRYWIEYKPGFGYRFGSQTTNPKRGNGWTNAPKYSTYHKLGMVMTRDDENGHIHYHALSEYDSLGDCERFSVENADKLPVEGKAYLDIFIMRKREYEQRKRDSNPA